MNALQAIKTQLNVTQTENGDIAYESTGSACLDFFSLCGGMRKNTSDLDSLFIKAYAENPVIAVKILFYMRNIRGGLGERNSFRVLLKELAVMSAETASNVLYAVPEYGRWDDLLVLVNSKVQKDVVSLIKKQIKEDESAMKENKDVSLLGKWLPSINTSSSETRVLAKKLSVLLGLKPCEYRKLCSKLREEIKILENNLRKKDYTFDYSMLPSQAMFKHKKAFIRNDGERYGAFLNAVIEQAEKMARGEVISDDEKIKLNAKTLYPYQIVAPFMNWYDNVEPDDSQKLSLEASWKSLNRESFNSRTIVVRDGSGSMYRERDDSPINVATSLALLFAEQLEGPFRNKFITFSERPQLVEIPEILDTLEKKLCYIQKYDEASNTDIGSVYELLFNVAKKGRVPADEMIERIIIISDMEFDNCAEGVSTFEYYKSKFEKEGYKLPEIVFWNVEARNAHLPVTENEKGVKLVSGASANIFSSVTSGDLKVVTPYEFMLKMLEPYNEFDNIFAS